MNATEQKWSSKVGYGRARAYVYDYDTGEELAAFAVAGAGEAGIWNDKRHIGTRLSYHVIDMTKCTHFTLTAADFPGRRIAVKLWGMVSDDRAEWDLLVDAAKGWKGNAHSRELAAAGKSLARVDIRDKVAAHMWAITR